MKIIHHNISVNSDAINPTLNFSFTLEFNYYTEIPIMISGRLDSQFGKMLSTLNENEASSEYILFLNNTPNNKRQNGNNQKSQINIELTSELSKKSIEHIESQRNKNNEKAVFLLAKIIIKILRLNQNNNIELKIEKQDIPIKINQSDWIKKFSPKLEIGKFFLVELKMPENKVSEFWTNLFARLQKNINDMEKNIQAGDWEKTLFIARKFAENIKIGDNKKGNTKFKNEFESIMKKRQHSQEGINNLYDAIWKLFEFLSKFSHEKDKEGNNYEILPIPNKEDAYFLYILSVGLFNLIFSKIE